MELKEFLANEVFPNVQAPVPVFGFATATDRVRKKDPHFYWDRTAFNRLLNWWKARLGDDTDDGFLLSGPPGAGKSSLVYQFAAALNIPVYEHTFTADSRFYHLLGNNRIVGRETMFQYGPLPLAMGVLGTPGILLLNEIDHAEEGVLTGIHEILNGQPCELPEGTLVKPMQGFGVCATANTKLLGDDTGQMLGAKAQNLALHDRFWKTKVNYLPEEEELKILKAKASLPEDYLRRMINVARGTRVQWMGVSDSGTALPITFSTRTLIRWAKTTAMFAAAPSPLLEGLKTSVLDGVDDVTAAAIEELAKGEFGDVLHGAMRQAA